MNSYPFTILIDMEMRVSGVVEAHCLPEAFAKLCGDHPQVLTTNNASLHIESDNGETVNFLTVLTGP